MRPETIRRIAFAVCVVFTAPLLVSSTAEAQPKGDTREAGKHFQRGVALFNEADYAGALAEFKKAYAISPNPAVLYNIGQTSFQLRNYAAALQALEKYLAESGPQAEHRAEVEGEVETLRSRVGKIDVVAPDTYDVAIDDEPAGKAPLPPLLAAVGRRKVTVSKDGQASQTKYVEVAAGEVFKIEFKPEPAPAAGAASVTSPPGDEKPKAESSSLPTILFIGAGALAVGAVVTGVIALGANSDLDKERTTPGSNRQKLDDLAGKTSTMALVTDILGGAAIVAAGAGLYFTLAKPSASATTKPTVVLKLGPGSAFAEGRF